MPHPPPREISIRPTTAADVPSLFAFECEPAANERAGTKPRDWPTFESRWAEILADIDGTRTRVVPRVILADGEVVGAVNISPQGDADAIGYWIAKEHWGRGIASRAVERMLEEYTRRPLYATVAAGNAPSLRILEKFGFVIESRERTPETARCVARETVSLVLR
ncbi:MAG: GNAT family N-acetyltransferase [Phycisphaerae bacterium]|nr:GNAT family N-acetyltransferase [Phycisphaerae bacterium]